MENKKYYFSIFFQDSESVETFDELREKGVNICEYAYNNYCGIGFEDNADNYTDYKPYCAKGSDFVVAHFEEYTMLCNNAIGGVYMLYREATEEETEWLEDQM